MKIVFLIIDYMPHQLVSIKAVIDYCDAEVTAFVHSNKGTIPDDTKNLTSISIDNLTKESLLAAIIDINPELLVVAGWAIPDYVWAAKQIKSKLNIPTVSYSDTQWRNTFRQNVNRVISPWHVQKAFSHLWVAGICQYEYARRLGYSKQNIIFGSLSCDMDRFDTIPLKTTADPYPKKMLFIGRFIALKGLDNLIKAWNELENKNGWELVLIGDGDSIPAKTDRNDIVIKGAMSQQDLRTELQNSGCFVFPSKWDQWGVVIHEAAVSGLPIIASNVCGATPHFVISGYNGYQTDPNVESLRSAMKLIIGKSDADLVTFGARSRKLSKSITPEIGAANLMSVIINNR